MVAALRPFFDLDETPEFTASQLQRYCYLLIDQLWVRERGENFASHVGRYLESRGFVVEREYAIDVGLGTRRRSHRFDFGSKSLLVECKYYGWTDGGNNPSAKISTLNESMLYFLGAPSTYRKMIFLAETSKKAYAVRRLSGNTMSGFVDT